MIPGAIGFVSNSHRTQNDLIDKSDIESLFHDLAACIPHLHTEIGILKKELHFLRNGFIVFHGDEKTIFPFRYCFPAAGSIRCDNRGRSNPCR